MPEGGASELALRKKRLQYICINTDKDKIRTLFRNVLPRRRCIIICHDELRAHHLAEVLNDLHREKGHNSKLTMVVDGDTPISRHIKCVVVSATGAALTEQEAKDFDTFVMHDNPNSKEQYKNWAWHSYCRDIISFLVNEPEDQNIRENYILDQLESVYKCQVNELSIAAASSPSSKSDSEKKKQELKERLAQEQEQQKLQRMQQQHKEETQKLVTLMEQLIVHQQKQQQEQQEQQQEQQTQLQSQIKALEQLLAQQQQQQQQQQQDLEKQLQAKIKELHQKEQEHQHMTAQLQVPTAQQFFSADPAHRTLMLQQMQQSMVQQQPPMQYMQAPPYGLMPGAVPVQVGPSAAAPMQPMQPPPPPGPPPPQKQRGGRREKAPAPPEATHNTANNPFDQAQGASAPSYYGGASEKQAKVQQLDQELEALRARLAEKQGDPGLWVPGKGYSNPPDAGGKGSKGGKGGKGQGKGGKGDAGHADQKQGPYVAAVFHTYGDDAADDNDEDWETAESWDASGY